jgi:hypothetical protein
LALVRNPLVLWGNYRDAGFSDLFGSFPPLLPLLFGLLVWPWTLVLPDFWAIRLGVLSWSLVTLWLLHDELSRTESRPVRLHRLALWTYALLPSVWGAIALIPQEEVYVSIAALLLYRAARVGAWQWVPILLVLTALAGKYFLLILILPLALASPTPIRNLFVFGGVSVATLAAYVVYHELAHGLMPILSHRVDPSAGVSVWALLWNLGIRPSPTWLNPLSVGLCGLVVLTFGLLARRDSLPLAQSFTISLLLTLLTLSITFPAYVLWAVPLSLICLSDLRSRTSQAATIALLVAWGVGEWGANATRGISANLTAGAGGKPALAEWVLALVGPDFPFHALHLGCLLLVVTSGIGLVVLLWADARAASGHPIRA